MRMQRGKVGNKEIKRKSENFTNFRFFFTYEEDFMPKNDYFQFKKFTIWQDRCAMKVSTDACILGALVEAENAQKALDIGTGTGLLAMFLAQKNPTLLITAIEIEPAAAEQAKDNFLRNGFEKQIKLIENAVQDFAKQANETLEKYNLYDLIICNPPYFVESTLSTNSAKNIARHNQTLSFPELAESARLLIAEKGKFWVILPIPEMQILQEKLKEKGLFPEKEISIRNFVERPAHRMISVFGKEKTGLETQELVIFEKPQTYTSQFVEHLKPYYLYL